MVWLQATSGNFGRSSAVCRFDPGAKAMKAAITDSGAPSITLEQADARAAAAAAAALTFGGHCQPQDH